MQTPSSDPAGSDPTSVSGDGRDRPVQPRNGADGDGADDTVLDQDALVDEWGAESFPASDPPNSWAGPPPPS